MGEGTEKRTCPQCGMGFRASEGSEEAIKEGPLRGRFLCGQCSNRHAAGLGCSICGGALKNPPASDPFPTGPHRGRYWCGDCWTLYWDEHPADLADAESRSYVAQEARRIRVSRAQESRLKERHGMAPGKDSDLLFEEGESKAYLTERGTVLLSLALSGSLSPDEYDPDRFALLVRAVDALRPRMAVLFKA